MKPTFCIILCTALVIAAQTSAFALLSDSFICKDGIVSAGTIAPDLVRKCGQPSYTSQHEEKIVEEGVFPGERFIISVVIDDWIFNFGPDRFQYRILLKNGRVWKIDSLDYGY